MSSLYAFISRHQPTNEQLAMAQEQGIVLEWIGDMDAFSVTAADIHDKGAYVGVVVVHPAAALRLAPSFIVGVFENGMRSEEGKPPSFYPVALHQYDLLDGFQ